jgi:hypothetical protein
MEHLPNPPVSSPSTRRKFGAPLVGRATQRLERLSLWLKEASQTGDLYCPLELLNLHPDSWLWHSYQPPSKESVHTGSSGYLPVDRSLSMVLTTSPQSICIGFSCSCPYPPCHNGLPSLLATFSLSYPSSRKWVTPILHLPT